MNSNQPIDSTIVKEELSRILKTPHFRSSKVLSNFLRYIVNQTLEGKEQYLKEYVIGTEVLKKGLDFNPQLDAIVRIHARRLRKLIEEYYSVQGIHDPVKISIPTGRYIPVFERNNTHEEKDEPSNLNGERNQATSPKIAIVPLSKLNNNERLDVICSSLCRDLGIALSKYQELSVISNYSVQLAQSNGKGMEEIINRLEPDYLLLVTCMVLEQDFSSTIELHSVNKNQLIWADSYQIEDYEQNALKNYRTIIRKVVANISGFLGVIYQDLLAQSSIPNDYDYMYAIYWHNKYHSHFSSEAFTEAYAAIEKGLEKNPENSLLNSIKAQLLLDQKTMEIKFKTDPLEEGMNLVMKALSLDNNNQHAWLMLGWASILSHNREKGVEAFDKCISINPNNNLIQSASGFGLICAGEYEAGWDLLNQSVQSPYYFWVTNTGLCLYHLQKQDFTEAYYWARLVKRPNFIWDPLLRLCCAGHLENGRVISEIKEELMKLSPNFTSLAAKLLGAFLLDKHLQNIMLDSLQKAGLNLGK